MGLHGGVSLWTCQITSSGGCTCSTAPWETGGSPYHTEYGKTCSSYASADRVALHIPYAWCNVRCASTLICRCEFSCCTNGTQKKKRWLEKWGSRCRISTSWKTSFSWPTESAWQRCPANISSTCTCRCGDRRSTFHWVRVWGTCVSGVPFSTGTVPWNLARSCTVSAFLCDSCDLCVAYMQV